MLGSYEDPEDWDPSILYFEKAQSDLGKYLVTIDDKTEDTPRALDLFRQHRFVHCDIKPLNIVIDNDGNLKFIDLALSFQGTPKRDDIYENKYIFWPPEIYLLSEHRVKEIHKYSVDTFYRKMAVCNSARLGQGKLPEILTKEERSPPTPDQLADTIDIFGLGSTLTYLYYFLKFHLDINEERKAKWRYLLRAMVNYDRTSRITDPEVLRDLYKEILHYYD